MNVKSLLSTYVVLVGTAMIAMWGGILMIGDVPELQTAPLELAFHLAAELLTALALIAAGIGLVIGHRWAGRLLPVALGMLLYTVINSAGYYAGLGEWAMVAFFGVLTATTLIALGTILGGSTGERRITATIERVRTT